MPEWLDENCGPDGWSIAPAGLRGVLDDAVAVYVGSPTCALGFITRWCVSDDPPSGLYRVRDDEPVVRVWNAPHKSPL